MIGELLNEGHIEEPIDIMDELLEKKDLCHALRVAARVARFVHNCRREKLTGIFRKTKIDDVKQRWILLVQQRDRSKPHFEQTQKQLNLQINANGLTASRGRIQGNYPIYLPRSPVFTRRKLVHFDFQAPVVRTMNSAIYRINHYPVDKS